MITRINAIAIKKTKYTNKQLVILSFLGGAFIAFGGLLSVLVTGNMPSVLSVHPGLVKLLFGALFPLGLILVALMEVELFTGNNSYMIVGVLRGEFSLNKLIRNFTWVYLFNFFGALFVAVCFGYYSELLNEAQERFVMNIGVVKTSLNVEVAFLRAVACNWLVCLALWMAARTESFSAKVIVIWFPIMAFVAMGFEHSIANMFFIPLAMLCGADISFYDFLIGNLLPVTLGNNIGGGIFVGVLHYYASRKL
ncbi:MAG: formate/nitrite transporter family protein [Flavobacteriaceae bacterium]|nr:formate/nitrite transporter family protein [Flavobacteriaceae bacterium]